MSLLLDTSMVVRTSDDLSPDRELAVNALKACLTLGRTTYLCSQNIIEFWNVATRPANKNGLGWPNADVKRYVSDLRFEFEILQNNQEVFEQWITLVERYAVQGKQVHDAHIAAFAIHYKVPAILTFNVDDFKRFTEIEVIHPADLIAKANAL